jgi:hypothetical protein
MDSLAGELNGLGGSCGAGRPEITRLRARSIQEVSENQGFGIAEEQGGRSPGMHPGQAGALGVENFSSTSSSNQDLRRLLLEVEIFGGFTWRSSVSTDGVSSQVAQPRRRALVAGGA